MVVIVINAIAGLVHCPDVGLHGWYGCRRHVLGSMRHCRAEDMHRHKLAYTIPNAMKQILCTPYS